MHKKQFEALIIFLIFVAMLSSCHNKTIQEIASDDDGIIMTKDQFEQENMRLESPMKTMFPEVVSFTGAIKTKVNGEAKISLPIEGLIHDILCQNGQRVKKGEVLFTISGHSFIDLQSSYAESAIALARSKSDYDRAKELYSENIGTKKEFALIESAYKTELVKNKALKLKLENIGLDANKIEQGQLYSAYTVKAPIQGVLSEISVSKGQFTNQDIAIARIIDPELLQLSLSVFEKDIQYIESGQQVEFYVFGSADRVNYAQIRAVGKSISETHKAIECYAEIDQKDLGSMVNNQFVKGQIVISSDSAYSLPETAFIKAEDDWYILELAKQENDNYYFSKVPVEKGMLHNNRIQITKGESFNKILINGAYNIVLE